MIRARGGRVLAAIVLVSAGACAAPGDDSPRPDSPAPIVRNLVPVVRVVDGDTIWVFRRGREEKIRFIGIDTPEVDWYGGQAECFGAHAGRFVRRLLSGEAVGLELDRERVDRYGRTLAYVFLDDGRFLNLLLVRRGLAEVTIFPPNVRFAAELLAAEANARKDPRGLWASCR